MNVPLLAIDRLEVDITVADKPKPIIRGITLEVARGQSVGLVGESGSGKSMTVRSVLRLLPHTATTRGDIRFDGTSVLAMDSRALREFRAHDVAMIFQDPRVHINPVRTIGQFLVDGPVLTRGTSRRDAEQNAVRQLRAVGIDDAPRRMRQHPHELSGGLLQRVMIAAALTADPKLLLADEPTTALDVTTQEEVMAILDELRREHGLAMLFITHDLDLATAACDRLAVMKDGVIVEELAADDIYDNARDPYTIALMAARAELEGRRPHPTAVGTDDGSVEGNT
ncbi:ABC transporter ATP-binding protein [Streptomyces sp. NPDC056390]|uniref:ABC transporter ATP-binding protein n=1 Tax=Streptomyces sp. NPDC056390 TaxID=3345806 RepID=UPI0035DC14CF